MANDGSSSPEIVNCTLTGNSAGDLGAAMYQGTYGADKPPASPRVMNSILWGNTISSVGPKEISSWAEDAPRVTYSIVEGSYPGDGNLDKDPEFVSPETGNFQLSSGSPAIDSGASAGAPATDIDGIPRDDAPDMGAYEWTEE